MIEFTGERIVPGASNCEPSFASKMYQEHVARYLFAAQLAQGKQVLDVGCGVGYGSQLLVQRGATSVLAFDLSAESIDHARALYCAPGVEFQVGDATDFEWGRRFDVVTAFELIEHVNDQEGVFRSIARHLSPNGVVVMSTPRALSEKRTDFHTHEFTLEAFRAMFERHFRRHSFYFENNHFSSLITDRRPEVVVHVEPLKNQFGLQSADYFVGVATQSDSSEIDNLLPVMTIDDDRYVLTLENDVSVLRRSETALLESVAMLRAKQAEIHNELEVLHRANTKLQDEVSTLRRTTTELSKENSRIDEQRAKAFALLAEVQRERDYLHSVEQAMRHSSSWRISAPLRLLGRPVRRTQGMVSRILEYRRRHGDRALVGAVRRRLTGSVAVNSLLSAAAGTQFGAKGLLASRPSCIDPADVLMLVGCWEGESKRYRVQNVAAALRSRGLRVGVLPANEMGRIADEAVRVRVVVVFRAPFEESFGVLRFLDYAKRQGISTVFDIDDFVFDPSIVDSVHGYTRLSTDEQRRYRDGVERYRMMMLASDLVTVTTPLLQREASKLGKRAFIVPNTVNGEQIKLAQALLDRNRPLRETITIAYFSGSNTHELDFAEVEPGLLRLLHERKDVRLLIVGFLDLGHNWSTMADRVEHRRFMPYLEMLECLADVDINIAPLQVGDAFCEAKSELKFFEAGLVGIPTVASATEPMRSAVEHGRTGLLVYESSQWYGMLQRLVANRAERRAIGMAARSVALDRFGIGVAADAALAAYGIELPVIKSAPMHEVDLVTESGRQRLRIDWVVPGLLIGGGGHRNILRTAYHLEQFGHDVTLYFTQTDKSPDELRSLLHEHFYPFKGNIRLADGSFRPADVLMATHWSTVDVALQARDQVSEVMYFVQDFEPAFAPMGSEYVLAENTYRHGLYCVTSGPWCEVYLKTHYGAEADHFKFPIDRSVYRPRTRTKSNPNIVFFAKPEMPRRCFELGALALRDVNAQRPDVEILMFGSPQVRQQALDYPVTVLKILPTIDDLAQMYSSADIGVVFSTTNPSLVPYEMMACGLPVVDLGRPGNEVNYDGRTDIALLADPKPTVMARQILALLDDVSDRERRSNAGIDFTDKFPSEEQMVQRVEHLIISRLAKQVQSSAQG
ncbi:MAG: glycosyltransferase [Pseudomonadota bacterium]